MPESTQAPTVREQALGELEELHAYVRQARRRRVIEQAQAEGAGELIEARVVYFTDGSHAFLTTSYHARVVTNLIAESEKNVAAPPPEVVERSWSELRPGDYLLFLEGADTDVIREVADRILPPGRRETAMLWKTALRSFQERESLSTRELWQRLKKDREFTHQLQTVRCWVDDEYLIAPRDAHDHELALIARVTGDSELLKRLDECSSAITDVWGAHLRAAQHLAAEVLGRCRERLAAGGLIAGGRVQVVDRVVLVQVEHVDPEPVQVIRSVVNRLRDVTE
jgi:hypothetical protein